MATTLNFNAQSSNPSKSFSNYFWGVNDEGYHALLSRFSEIKHINEDLRSFFHERASIEEDYAKRMAKLARSNVGANETGTLKQSIQSMKTEVDTMGKNHLAIAQLLQDDVSSAFSRYAISLKDKKKTFIANIEKCHKDKDSKKQSFEKAQDKYHYLCKKVNYYVSQQNMLVGKELERNNYKLNKTQNSIASSASEYKASVQTVSDTYNRWIKEWKIACDKLQDIEEERRHFLRSVLWTFTLLVSRSAFNDDEACERIRKSLETCNVKNDVLGFIDSRATGTGIPQPPKFYDFYKGESPEDVVELVQANFERAPSNVENDNMTLNRPYTLSAAARTGNATLEGSSGSQNVSAAVNQTAASLSSNSSQSGRMSPRKKFFSKFKKSSRPVTPNVLNPSSDMTPMDENFQKLSMQSNKPDTESGTANPPPYQSVSPISRRQQIQDEFSSVMKMENRAVSPISDNRKNNTSLSLRKTQSSRPSSSTSRRASRLPRSLTPGAIEPDYEYGVKADPVGSLGGSLNDDDYQSELESSITDDFLASNGYGVANLSQPMPGEYDTEEHPSLDLETPTSSDGQKILGYVHALYDYNAAIPEEISFQKGDTIAVIRLYEDGWWEGFVVGDDDHNRGQFPSNFVRQIDV
ncbi:contractile ring protein Imp2 [Schizosaccharomyces cryophilus OY26]|uniref:Contractile ring protein Imp2 n=1 Tax=Schizosaccharomyces cryophilus (strain OY26 / ATCC MYA-4695 / CBS 11777 / NBRC 106824 / NRRL Y48691) TaxID=653667 RepID=S9VRU6_SCHCR|nr:contractile ring protein Imp2 [Schizosaccharomyces cryophilus OY26]EPY50658.1 contractile ring protein Imp2 [Schizosaccharomyces cryophilus OY26]